MACQCVDAWQQAQPVQRQGASKAWLLRPDPAERLYEPLVSEAGTDVQLHLKLEARGEMNVNLIDLSVKESVQQFNRGAEVEAE